MTKKETFRLYAAWPTKTISVAFASVIMGYMTYYATDIMGIPAATAGIIFMLSKIFDGFTDFLAGYAIDNTNTRLGQARPYELAIIGYWVCIAFLFRAPEMGIRPACIYLFVLYTASCSIFSTMITCNETIYLANVLENKEENVSLLTFNGFVTLIFSAVAAVIVPKMIVNIGDTREGWAKISFILAIPMTLVGIIRFLVVKERKRTVQEKSAVSLKDALKALFQNKYVWILCAILLLANIGVNIGNATYYFKYVMHDLGIASYTALALVSVPVALILMPILCKKHSVKGVLTVYMAIGLVGFLLRLLDVESIPLVFVSTLLSNLAFTPLFMFIGSMIIDCYDYGEWRTGIRADGVVGCVSGIASKVGVAVGAGLMGILTGLAGYDGTLEVQPASAYNMILALNTIVPAIICVIGIILFHFYDLDKKIGGIRTELAGKEIQE